MKIRIGFVSNSSSSSFVVAFDARPKSKEEVQKLLFGNKKTYANPYCDSAVWKDAKKNWPAEEVAQTVWEDLSAMNPLTKEEFIEELRCGSVFGAGHPKYDWKRLGKRQEEKYEEQYRKRCEKWAKGLATEFLKNNKGKVLFMFTYSDNDGEYRCALEHGKLFRGLPHIEICNH